jgi:hypothetical protein
VAACAPDGRVFVAEDPMDIRLPQADAAEGRILCLFPDGRTTVFADNLYAVFGLQYLEGKLYVLHNPRFSVFDDDDGVGRNRRDLISQTLPEPSALNWNDHVPANFRLAMDGYFYAASGDKGLFGAQGTDGSRADLSSGGIFRIRPDGTGLDLVAAYASIANLGARVEPRFITRIEDGAGETVWQNPMVPPRAVLDPAVAFIVRDMLRDVVERGTATAVRADIPESMPVAGKTGTTNENTDVWFVGMTPEVVAGVWIGFDRPRTITPGAAGGSLAAPIWSQMVARGGAGKPGVPWIPPSGVTSAELDRVTGRIADPGSPPESRYTEYFLGGTEPLPVRLDSWGVIRGRRSGIR